MGRKKNRIYFLLIFCLFLFSPKIYALGIINTQSVLIKAEKEAKGKIDKKNILKSVIVLYEEWIGRNNDVISAQIVELYKIRELKRALLIESLGQAQRLRKLNQRSNNETK